MTALKFANLLSDDELTSLAHHVIKSKPTPFGRASLDWIYKRPDVMAKLENAGIYPPLLALDLDKASSQYAVGN